MTESMESRRIFSRIGFAMALFLGVQQGAVVAISALVNYLSPEAAQAGWYLWVLSYVPLYLIAFPVFLLVIRTIPDSERSFAEEESGGKPLSAGGIAKLAVISLGLVYPIQLLMMLLSSLVAQIRGAELINPLAEVVLNSNPWINLLFLAGVAPIMEEIIFRRILYNKLIRFGGRCYVLFSAFVFALFHANLYQMIYAFLLGVLFAGVVYYTGTIRYSIILHVIINLIGSGVGPILLAYAGEIAVGIWGIIILLLTVSGLIMGISWWVKHRRSISFSPGQVEASGRTALANPGMIVYMLLIALLVTATLLAY